MADSPLDRNEEEALEEERLQGTFVLVFFVGGFLVAVWLILFFIYLSRL
ncbi:MAG: cytochrome c oxidase subunit 2A [Deltaproteobacteria bacterium]|nr:cytochrome c oxidase subunit 2A [Deltaproteobacteria bacterium]